LARINFVCPSCGNTKLNRGYKVTLVEELEKATLYEDMWREVVFDTNLIGKKNIEFSCFVCSECEYNPPCNTDEEIYEWLENNGMLVKEEK
jgi:hypothetical protein